MACLKLKKNILGRGTRRIILNDNNENIIYYIIYIYDYDTTIILKYTELSTQ